jgi:hypothetical protein
LNKAIFKALAGQTREQDYKDLEDFKYIDFNVFNSMKFYRDNNLDDFKDIIEQYYTSDVNSSFSEGGTMSVELVPKGA